MSSWSSVPGELTTSSVSPTGRSRSPDRCRPEIATRTARSALERDDPVNAERIARLAWEATGSIDAACRRRRGALRAGRRTEGARPRRRRAPGRRRGDRRPAPRTRRAGGVVQARRSHRGTVVAHRVGPHGRSHPRRADRDRHAAAARSGDGARGQRPAARRRSRAAIRRSTRPRSATAAAWRSPPPAWHGFSCGSAVPPRGSTSPAAPH